MSSIISTYANIAGNNIVNPVRPDRIDKKSNSVVKYTDISFTPIATIVIAINSLPICFN